MESIILDFIEENWAIFLARCEEHGMSEEDVENEIDKMKKDNGMA